MMFRWNSQITSDCWPTIPNPSHPFSPSPAILRDSAYFSCLVPYHRPVCRFAHGHTGVFHNTSFDINYWHDFRLKHSPVCIPFLAWLFAHFRNTSLPKNVPLFCRTKLSRILVLRHLLVHVLYWTHTKYLCLRNKTPLPPFVWELVPFMRVG